MQKAKGIKKQLLRSLIAFGVIPMILIGSAFSYAIGTMLTEQSINVQKELAKNIASRISDYIKDCALDTDTLLALLDYDTLSPKKAQDILDRVIEKDSRFERLTIYNNLQFIIADASHANSLNKINPYLDLTNVAIAIARESSYFSQIWFNPNTKDSGISVATPLFKNKQLKAIIVADISMTNVFHTLQSSNKTEGLNVFISDNSGRIIAFSQNSYMSIGQSFTVLIQKDYKDGVRYGLNAHKVISAKDLCYVGENEFHVFVERDIDVALHFVNKMNILIIISLCVTVFLAFIFGLHQIKKIIIPLENLKQAALNFSNGDFAYRVPLQRNDDEIKVLSKSFNSMADRLADTLQKMQESDLLFKSFMKNVPGYVYLINSNNEIIFENKEIIDHELQAKNHAELKNILSSGYSKIASLSPNSHIETEIHFESKTYSKYQFPLTLNGILYTGGISIETTRRINAERSVMQEKERLLVTLRSIADGVIATDKDGQIVVINRVIEKLTGIPMSSAKDLPVSELLSFNDPKYKQIIQDTILNGKTYQVSSTQVHIYSRNEELTVEVSTAPIYDPESRVQGAVLVIRDISDRMKLEEVSRNSAKLESLGVLAGGIAHDFNNILTAIVGNISLARFDLKENSETYELLDQAERAALRAKQLTAQLLTFARGGDPIKENAHLDDLLKECITFVLSGSGINVEYKFSLHMGVITIDRGQISQVVQNLAINASQAMKGHGNLFINLDEIDISEMNDLGLESGNYLRITFKDSGPGIAPNTIDRIFEPYFTTKKTGSGLGLAIAYSILKRHNGTLTAENVSSGGALFTMYLPNLNSPASINIKIDAETQESFSLKDNKSIRILVLEDEEPIRALIQKICIKEGIACDFTCTGQEALNAYNKALELEQPYKLCLMDLTVPGSLSGNDTFQLIRENKVRPNGIVMSGYSSDPVMAHYKEAGFLGFLIKPFTRSHFLSAIQEALAQIDN